MIVHINIKLPVKQGPDSKHVEAHVEAMFT